MSNDQLPTTKDQQQLDTLDKRARLKTCQINNALGLFILLFGFIVVFSMSLSETFKQQMTNIVAGGVLVFIGGGMVWYSRRTIRKHGLKEFDGKDRIETTIEPE